MKAVILVGGEGTRLRPLTLHCLKSMVPMAGRPFLEYQLDFLRRHGIREVVLSICHLPHLIRRAFGEGRRYGLRLHYAAEHEPLGTAGAIKNAQRFIGSHEPTVVLNGDVLNNFDLQRMAAVHRRNRAVATLALTRVSDPSAYGVVLQDQHHRVLNFLEKPGPEEHASPWVNAGVYIFEPEVFDHIPAGQAYSAERGLFPGLLKAGLRLWAFPSRGYWMDIGTLARYHQAQQDILEGRMFMLPVGKPYRSTANIRIGARCRIHPEAEVVGPAVLGRSCRLGSGARVGEGTVLGNNVELRSQAWVEHSVIWDHVVIGEGARLSGCLVADGCRIGRHAHVRTGSALGQGSVIPDYSRV